MHLRTKGFSLVEIMLALVLGLIFAAATAQTHLSNQETARVTTQLSKHMDKTNFLYFHMMLHLRETEFNVISNYIEYDPSQNLLSFDISNGTTYTYQLIGNTIYFNGDELISDVKTWNLNFRIYNDANRVFYSANNVDWTTLIPNQFVIGLYAEIEFSTIPGQKIPFFIGFRNIIYGVS